VKIKTGREGFKSIPKAFVFLSKLIPPKVDIFRMQETDEFLVSVVERQKGPAKNEHVPEKGTISRNFIFQPSIFSVCFRGSFDQKPKQRLLYANSSS